MSGLFKKKTPLPVETDFKKGASQAEMSLLYRLAPFKEYRNGSRVYFFTEHHYGTAQLLTEGRGTYIDRLNSQPENILEGGLGDFVNRVIQQHDVIGLVPLTIGAEKILKDYKLKPRIKGLTDALTTGNIGYVVYNKTH